MKLAILGGSFNPIHIGHLHLADSVLSAFGFDRLLLVPANISPFKQPREDAQKPFRGASALDRLDMILASITSDPRIAADDLELKRGGVSYTIDTLKEIVDRYEPEGKPALVLGDDLIEDFSKWKDAPELANLADIIIARRVRGNSPLSFPYPHKTLDNEVLDISSEMIRERIAGSKAWHYLVPRGARFIIEERTLYREIQKKNNALNGINNELIARVEDAARAALSPKRFIHSRNTALLARDLAIRFGLDENAAYMAGIAHDMTKNQSSDIDHGKTAAVLLKKRFGIHNKDVLEAVEAHTIGKYRMGDIAKVVFIADKIEFSRINIQKKLRNSIIGKKNSYDIDELFYAVLKNNVAWLKESGIDAAEETLRLLHNKGGENDNQ